MDKARKIIDDNKKDFVEFQYYHNIIDKIEENIEVMPDITIESCKSLIEGISKTILSKLEISYSENGKNADAPRTLLKKVLDNILIPEEHDQEFVYKLCELVNRMTEIRNKRGDISHGRLSPKEANSDFLLAGFIASVTNEAVYYILSIFFKMDFSYLKGLRYEDNIDFNQYLDEEYSIGGVLYSRALFDQDLVAYNERLNDYLFSKEEEII